MVKEINDVTRRALNIVIENITKEFENDLRKNVEERVLSIAEEMGEDPSPKHVLLLVEIIKEKVDEAVSNLS